MPGQTGQHLMPCGGVRGGNSRVNAEPSEMKKPSAKQHRAGERPAHGSAVRLIGKHGSESAHMHSLKRCTNQQVGSLIDRRRYVGSNPAAPYSQYPSLRGSPADINSF